MKKKVLSITLVVCLLAIAVVGGTLAYFVDEDDATNTFTVGNVQIDLFEKTWDGVDYDGTQTDAGQGLRDASEVYPGEVLAKDPKVENEGSNPCFVRISVEGLDCLGNAGDITYKTAYVPGALGADWVLHTDGFYYYTKVLNAEEITPALFDQIVIPTGLTNGDAETEFDIDVTAYAVQAQGMDYWRTIVDPTSGEKIAQDVTKLAGWFTTCGF